MNILAYGEDALTLWALKNKLEDIVGEKNAKSDCEIFYRPSFGRGGKSKALFGEFDFIILAKQAIYLGESKWNQFNRNSKKIPLKDNQILRHQIFWLYIQKWFNHGNLWDDGFMAAMENELKKVNKVLPSSNSILKNNLRGVLGEIFRFYECKLPKVINMVLYFSKRTTCPIIKTTKGEILNNFNLNTIDDYPDNFKINAQDFNFFKLAI